MNIFGATCVAHGHDFSDLCTLPQFLKNESDTEWTKEGNPAIQRFQQKSLQMEDTWGQIVSYNDAAYAMYAKFQTSSWIARILVERFDCSMYEQC